MIRRRMRVQLAVFATGGLLGALFSNPAFSADAASQQQLVDKATLTVEAFAADDGMKGSLKQLGEDAKALFVIPQFMRGAFIFGGAGGSGVLMVRDEKTGKWGEPIFYNIGSASFGLQIGADVSEMLLVVRTQKGLEEFYTNDFKLGANVGIAAGPVGAGVSAKGVSADIVSYAKKKGAFAGLALDGALISVSNDANAAYYGKSVRPIDIVVKKEAANDQSLKLRNAVDTLMK